MHRDTGLAADVFVIGAFIGVLKSSPSAHVINKDVGKICLAVLNVLNHLRQRFPAFNVQAALALVRILLYDFHTPALGIFADDIHLVAGGVLLVLGGHPHIRSGVIT